MKNTEPSMTDKTLHFLDKFDHLFVTSGWIAGGLGFIMMAIITREVVGRYFFNAPTDWALDINALIFVAMVYIGSAYTTAIDGHVKADFFYRHFGGKLKDIIDIFIYIVCICYAAVLVWQGILLSYESYIANEVSSGSIRVPLFPFEVLVPLGSFFVILCFLSKMVRSVLSLCGRRS